MEAIMVVPEVFAMGLVQEVQVFVIHQELLQLMNKVSLGETDM